MARGILWCSLLLTISARFSQAQQNNSPWNSDQIIFDGPTERPLRFPLNPQRPTSRPDMTTTDPTNNASTPPSSAAYDQCYNNCRVTSEYNPVCGSDNVVYSNPGRLGCAQNCGNPVRMIRFGQCSNNQRG